MKVGYAVLYEDGELVISADSIKLSKKSIIFFLKKRYKDYGKFDDDNIPWKEDSKKIKTIQILDQVKANCMNTWFEDCYNLTTLIDFQNLNVSNCENFGLTFCGCESLINISSLKD